MTAQDEGFLNQNPGKGRAEKPDPAEKREAARQLYADAHYEPAGSTTVPPRFYTPPVREPRQSRSAPRRKKSEKRFGLGAVIGLCLTCAIVGGMLGAAAIYGASARRLRAMEGAMQEVEGECVPGEESISAPEQQSAKAATPDGSRLPSQAGTGDAEENAYLGVWLDEKYNLTVARYYDMPLGAYVDRVEPGSAAERAGLQDGDIVIQIGGMQVENSTDLREALRQYGAGDSADLVLYHAGDQKTVTVVFDERTPESGEVRQDGDHSN